MAHGSSVVENSLRLYYLVITVYNGPHLYSCENVAFVCTTIILCSRHNWYALVKSCINVNHDATSLLKYVWFTKFTKFWSEVKNGMAPPLGYPKTKKLSASGGFAPLIAQPAALPKKCVNNITGLCYCQDRFTSIARAVSSTQTSSTSTSTSTLVSLQVLVTSATISSVY